MGLAVLTYYTCTVNAKHHMELSDSYIVDKLVVGSLEECGIHCENRRHAHGSKSACKGDGMLLGDSDIKKSVRILEMEELKSCSVLHSRCDSTELVVLFSKSHKFLAENGRIAVGSSDFGISRGYVKFRDTVVFTGVLLRRDITLALYGLDMDEHRLVIGLSHVEDLLQL